MLRRELLTLCFSAWTGIAVAVDVTSLDQDADTFETLNKNELLDPNALKQRARLLDALERYIKQNEPKEGDRYVLTQRQRVGRALRLMGELRAVEKSKFLAAYLDYRVMFEAESSDSPSRDEKWPGRFALGQLGAAGIGAIMDHIAANPVDDFYLSQAWGLILMEESAQTAKERVQTYIKKVKNKDARLRLEKLCTIWEQR